MGFFSWLFCAILVVALVLLLFPFSFRIDFEAGERGVRALFFFFKKKIYEYEKKWKEDAGSKELSVDDDERRDAPESVKQDAPPTEAVAKKPTETSKTEPMDAPAGTELGIKNPQDSSLRVEDTPEKRESRPSELGHDRAQGGGAVPHPVKSSVSNESVTQDAPPTEVKSSPVVEVSSEANVAESEKPVDEKNAEDKKPKKEKRKLSDREFWTIILTPDLDARVFKYILKILKSALTLFRVRFSDCFVEGIRTDYQTMGYIAAVNGFLKAYPYVGDWDLRMDWCNEKELRAVGSVRLNITLLRIFCFTLETLVLAGILAFSFWRRRAHVIKTNELPQLGFIRRRILEFILED
ncbi:hypothetical protein [Fibrobacter succinogenes]|uniref:hypothetical protein n=1 Tax=Fibrobacter succinogenes TaxID=833 RepID=UPI0015693798|nr:hypothetical protein [Fibrobacter succinogenes]